MLIFLLTVLFLAALAGCCVLFVKLQNKNSELQGKTSDLQEKVFAEQIFAKDRVALQEKREASEIALAQAQNRKKAAAEKFAEAEAALQQAQEQCGLNKPLSAEDFIDWLRKLENAVKLESEYHLCRQQQEAFFVKADQLRQILLECRTGFAFYNGDAGDFYALVGAAEEKQQAVADVYREIGRQEEQQKQVLVEKQSIAEKLSANKQQQSQAEETWQALLRNCFNGQIADSILQEKLSLLSDLIPLKVKAEHLLNTMRALTTEITAEQNRIPDIPQDILSSEAELHSLQEKTDRLEEQYRQALTAKTKAETALQQISGGDKIAQLEQQQQLLILEMQEKAEEYLRQEFGLKLAQAALLQYRKTHRGGMMAATERAFAALTDGTYQNLQTRPDGDKEFLQAVAADGSLKDVPDMSKGTRFQLYMALRAAAYEEYLLKRNINFPFFCDDIFETFDDERTKAACVLMEQIGQKGQAIYFTHHSHVVDIAKKICGDNVTVHFMD